MHPQKVQGQDVKADLDANELVGVAVLILDGGDGEQVPEGGAIALVVEQAHGAAITGHAGIPDGLNLLGVRALPLQEAAAASQIMSGLCVAGRGVSEVCVGGLEQVNGPRIRPCAACLGR